MQSSMVKFHALGEGFVLQNVIVAANHTIIRHMYSINTSIRKNFVILQAIGIIYVNKK